MLAQHPGPCFFARHMAALAARDPLWDAHDLGWLPRWSSRALAGSSRTAGIGSHVLSKQCALLIGHRHQTAYPAIWILPVAGSVLSGTLGARPDARLPTTYVFWSPRWENFSEFTVRLWYADLPALPSSTSCQIKRIRRLLFVQPGIGHHPRALLLWPCCPTSVALPLPASRRCSIQVTISRIQVIIDCLASFTSKPRPSDAMRRVTTCTDALGRELSM